jgi:hypothetical protein
MRIIAIVLMCLSMPVFATEMNHSAGKEKSEASLENIVKKGKSKRRTKAKMCHDCGKPETECTCEGEEHRKE